MRFWAVRKRRPHAEASLQILAQSPCYAMICGRKVLIIPAFPVTPEYMIG